MILNEYNQKSVEKLIDSFDKHEKVLYVSGVGTGKSYVFMKLMVLYENLRALYVLPKYAIQENLSSYPEFRKVKSRVTFCTYNSFTSVEKGLSMIELYDIVVIDEAHHLGSDVYGKNILDCMNQAKETNFLGLTATPIREEGHVDVTQFFEDRVDGLSHFQAIELGLMPKFEYRISIPEIDLNDAKKENPETRIKLNYFDCEEVMVDITKKFPRDKWITFFSTISAIKAHKEMIMRIFPGYEIFELHADLNNLKATMESFATAEKAVILSCNMLLEGVHIPGVDAVALFRNVSSIVAFQQMLGRVCRIGGTVEPLVVDNSSSGPELLAKLMYEGQTRNGGKHKTRTDRDIMRIGLGDHEAWDGVDEFLKRLERNKPASQEEIRERAEATYEKYLSFRGKTEFATIEEFRKDKTQYKKFCACAEFNQIAAERAFVILLGKGCFGTITKNCASAQV